MNRTCRVAGLAVVAALCLTIGSAFNAHAKAPAGQDAAGAKQQYTMAEYNAYQAAQAERNPTQQIKLLDDFVSKYPNSALLVYVYPLYYNAYSQLKNWPKVMEYADKLLALGEKSDPPTRYSAYYARAFAYTNQQQSTQVKTYLRKLIANYQGGNVCDTLTDAELNELLQLAGSSAERPASYK